MFGLKQAGLARVVLTGVVAVSMTLSVAIAQQPPAAAERLLREHINGWKDWLPSVAKEDQR